MKDKLNDLILEIFKSALVGENSVPTQNRQSKDAEIIRHELIGQYVICRSYSAGVHAGIVAAVDDNHVLLHESRRLHGWKAAPSEEASVALNSVAKYGIAGDLRIDVQVKKILINGFIELIKCEPVAEKSIREYVTKKDGS